MDEKFRKYVRFLLKIINTFNWHYFSPGTSIIIMTSDFTKLSALRSHLKEISNRQEHDTTGDSITHKQSVPGFITDMESKADLTEEYTGK